jgi:hypothetical protein
MSEYGEKYPWLKRNRWDDEEFDENNSWDCMDEMPEGWKIAFGEMMCEELDQVIKEEKLENDFTVLQVKEKYASLRFYCAPSTPKIDDIVNKYEYLSQFICQNCGRVDISTLDFGWLAALCKDCYEKHINCTKPYEEVVCDDSKMPNIRKYRQWSKEYDPTGYKDFEVDISETVNEIRRRWEERQLAMKEAKVEEKENTGE